MSFLILLVFVGCFLGYFLATRILVGITAIIAVMDAYSWFIAIDWSTALHNRGYTHDLSVRDFHLLTVYSLYVLVAMWLTGAYVRSEGLRPFFAKVFSRVLR